MTCKLVSCIRQFGIDAGPCDAVFAVPVHLRLDAFRVIERADPDRYMLVVAVLVGNGRATASAEAAPDEFARLIPMRLAGDKAERLAPEQGRGSKNVTQSLLAHAAVAIPHTDWRRSRFVSNLTAQTSTAPFS